MRLIFDKKKDKFYYKPVSIFHFIAMIKCIEKITTFNIISLFDFYQISYNDMQFFFQNISIINNTRNTIMKACLNISS
jgi:hypothetical protein